MVLRLDDELTITEMEKVLGVTDLLNVFPVKDCADPAIPRHANISNPSDKYNSGYKVTFKCNEGYNQEGIATQMCFQGKWTVLPFKCSGTYEVS